MQKSKPDNKLKRPLPKAPTGIRGLDEITLGGIPRGRATLLCGGAGSGKTLFGMEFLIHGATELNEPGVCLSFEETEDELAVNTASIGFDVEQLTRRKKLVIDQIYIERSQMEESGDFDLEGLFLRLAASVEAVGAKRVLLDSLEALFSAFENEAILRAELRRLFRWIKERNLTAVVTAERGQNTLTRYGIEEYISDCVILLDNRVVDAVSTRRLRVVKYRGSTHGTNEYPFLIDSDGISVLPVTSLELDQEASDKRISTGITALDEMLGGTGIHRASSVLISGTAGTGKSSLGAHFVNAACARGERCVVFSFEESPQQTIRNMRSIGINLKQWVDKGLLLFHAARPSTFGLEMHLVTMYKAITEFQPANVVVDPITAVLHAGGSAEANVMILRLIDFLKGRGITAVMTSLTNISKGVEHADVQISSLVDTWILLRDIESGGERNRGVYVLKARGLPHSNQIREYLISERGIELRPVYLGSHGLLTGSARVAHEASEMHNGIKANEEIRNRKTVLERKRKYLEAQIAGLQLELETEAQELNRLEAADLSRVQQIDPDGRAMARSRAESTEETASRPKTARRKTR